MPFHLPQVIDSDAILSIDELPRSLTVVGAGVIGLEYATIFSALDVKVSLIDRRDTMLDFLDREIVNDLEYHLRDRGVVLRLGEQVDAFSEEAGRIVTRLASGKQLRSDLVLYAAGRIGCTASLALDRAGLAADDRGRLSVNDSLQTDLPHVFAAGDVIGFPSLASTSMEQGRLAACHAFGHPATSSSESFPFGIYAVPEISVVGRTEQDLREKGVGYEVGTARLRETARGQILGLDKGILKILFSLETRRVLGVHILGEGATELIHIGQAALVLGGTVEYFIDTVFNYPTLAEAYKVAALDAWNRMPRAGQPARSGRLDEAIREEATRLATGPAGSSSAEPPAPAPASVRAPAKG